MEEKPNNNFFRGGGGGKMASEGRAVGVWTAVFKDFFPFSNPSAQIKKMSLVQITGF